MSDAEPDTPFWARMANTPDSHFPLGLHHAPLVVWPDRGWRIEVTCCVCRRTADFSGRDLCRLFPAWLTRDVCEWARALKCDQCGSRRLSLATFNDPAAGGFREMGHRDSQSAMRMRRLLAWLPEGGLRLDDVAYLLRDVDAKELRDGGLPEEVWSLFQGGYRRCTYYCPSVRSNPSGSSAAPEDNDATL